MGAGASSGNGGQVDVLSATAMVGRAFSAITFPDLYKIQDFHSDDAPPLKQVGMPPIFAAIFGNNGIFAEIKKEFDLQNGIEADPEEEKTDSIDPKNIEEEEIPLGESGVTDDGRFAIVTGEDRVILDNVSKANEDGWTPLHACCHSFTTASAALLLIDQMAASKGDLNQKTLNGPGAYNSGWTPLHMACAYGLENVVERLCNDDTVDVNCVNGNSMTPLLECCYRGYISIAKILIRAGADVHYLPEKEKFRGAPFIRPHPQRPIGEASRCGFLDIVKLLLAAGCGVDEANDLKWSPLHEACFCNHLDVVKMLMDEGADSTTKTEHGALPYQLAVTSAIRAYITEFGGKGSLPDNDEPFSNLMFGSGLGGGFSFMFDAFGAGDDNDDEVDENYINNGGRMNYIELVDDEDDEDDDDFDKESERLREAERKMESEENDEVLAKSPTAKNQTPDKDKDKDKDKKDDMLNEGGLLGDLPSLTPVKSPSSSGDGDKDKKLNKSAKKEKGKRTKEKLNISKIPPELVPDKFKCEITKKIMKRPMRTPNGNVYEEKKIVEWISKQGSIDPLSGVPLSKAELMQDGKLASEIVHWAQDYFAKKYEEKKKRSGRESPVKQEIVAAVATNKTNIEDEYDF